MEFRKNDLPKYTNQNWYILGQCVLWQGPISNIKNVFCCRSKPRTFQSLWCQSTYRWLFLFYLLSQILVQWKMTYLRYILKFKKKSIFLDFQEIILLWCSQGLDEKMVIIKLVIHYHIYTKRLPKVEHKFWKEWSTIVVNGILSTKSLLFAVFKLYAAFQATPLSIMASPEMQHRV